MRKVLLTSSQVSVLASSAIVILCTLALFLSGYTIQQRTLRELRAAIRPRESPKAHLPDHFKVTTTVLEDGSVITVEGETELQDRDMQEAEVVEVELSTSEPETAPQEEAESSKQEDAMPKDDNKKEGEENDGTIEESTPGKATREQIDMVEKIRAQVAEKSWAVENPDPLSKNRAPLTKAERRKMIKDEIKRLAQSDRPVYYQRRLW